MKVANFQIKVEAPYEWANNCRIEPILIPYIPMYLPLLLTGVLRVSTVGEERQGGQFQSGEYIYIALEHYYIFVP